MKKMLVRQQIDGTIPRRLNVLAKEAADEDAGQMLLWIR